jgi:hypothetical protein
MAISRKKTGVASTMTWAGCSVMAQAAAVGPPGEHSVARILALPAALRQRGKPDVYVT